MSHVTAELAYSSGKVHGIVARGYEAVLAAFENNLVSGLEIGASFAVYRDGAPLVDLWGGQTVGGAGPDIAVNTLYGIFSATKGVAAICIAMLVDRGKLDYETPVAFYRPQFAAAARRRRRGQSLPETRKVIQGCLLEATLSEWIGVSDKLRADVADIRLIGNALSPRDLLAAMHDGHRAARAIQ